MLVTSDMAHVKLADFGLAREETISCTMTCEAGTYRWMAPEVIFLAQFSTQCFIETHTHIYTKGFMFLYIHRYLAVGLELEIHCTMIIKLMFTASL